MRPAAASMQVTRLLDSCAMKPESLAIRRLQHCGVPVSPEQVTHLRAYFEVLRSLEAATNWPEALQSGLFLALEPDGVDAD